MLSAVEPGDDAIVRNVLNLAPIGVVVLAHSDVVTWTNARAEEILVAGDRLRMRRGRLRAISTAEGQELRRAIGAATEPPGTARCLWLRGRSALPALEVRIAPLACDAMWTRLPRPAALVLIGDPSDRPRPSARLLAELYGLTPTEARVAIALASGIQVRAIAAHLEVQPNTVRVHLKAIYAKTHTTGQVDLVRRLVSGLATSGNLSARDA